MVRSMNAPIESVEGVIDALGGVCKAAASLDQKPNTVCNWKTRRRIPPEHFLAVSEALRAAGCAVLPEVFGMSSPQELRGGESSAA